MPVDEPEAAKKLDVFGSATLPEWLAERQVSLAFTTYQASRLMLVGISPQGRLTVNSRTFPRCMGLFASSDSQVLMLATNHQIWRLANVLQPGGDYEGCDRLYLPRIGYTTGRLDTHDIVVDSGGKVFFVATGFNCIATLDSVHSFAPVWKPAFISTLANQDRCHLNGLALRDGKPRYVTAVAQTDVADGWRDWRADGGVVIDIETNEVIAQGLSMPHSPRYRDGKLWLHNAGTGEFGYVADGDFTPVAFCPGFLRGLAFVDNYAIVGLSKPRDKTFTGLPLQERLEAAHAKPQCGLHIIDLATGQTVEWLRVEGPLAELYDVAVLPGTKLPTALSPQSEEVEKLISVP